MGKEGKKGMYKNALAFHLKQLKAWLEGKKTRRLFSASSFYISAYFIFDQ
jgi:hypothetical protein